MTARRLEIAILVFATLNGVLYSTLLPLWEGFDEAFHYGYVQHIRAGGGVPVLGRTRLEPDVWRSMHDSPASHVVARSYPSLLTFGGYFAGAHAPSAPEPPPPNYEAHQAPLAYLVLAPVDAGLSSLPVRSRVLWLRIFAACVAVALTFFACRRLAAAVGLGAPFRAGFLFCVFSCQMFYASVAHVANDWLAVPALAWLLVALLDVVDRPSRRNALFLGITTAVVLLSKAYFLALLPLVIVVIAWRRAALAWIGLAVAAPWYVRNLVLYSNVTGAQESYQGIGPMQVWQALAAVQWPATIGYMARASLWTGNNSFTSFSAMTLDVMLLVIAAGLALFVLRRKLDGRDTVLISAMGLHCIMLIYATGAIYSRTHGAAAGASPWYSIPLLAPVYAVVFAGFRRAGPAARWLTIAFVAISAYVLLATYFVKLLPLYSGYDGPGRISALVYWYTSGRLSALVSIAPPAIVLALAVAVLASALVLGGIVCARVFQLTPRAGRQAGSAAFQ